MRLLSFKLCVILALLISWGGLELSALELNKFYGSGSEPGTGNVTVFTNSTQVLDFFYLDAAGELASLASTPYMGLADWRQGLLPAPSHSFAGGKCSTGDSLVVPLFFPDAQGIPSQSGFIPLETDPPNDHLFNLDHLDILSTKIAFSETRLYFSIKCNTMEYPVNSGLTFYSYMGVLTEPGSDPSLDPIVYALMNTVTAPGVITPGLYKIVGTGIDDLVLIGEIEVAEDSSEGVLTLSCAMSDLLADPDFSAWFNPQYPLVATIAMTSRITLGAGNLVSDTTIGADVLLLPWEINFANEQAPVLSDPVFGWANGVLEAQIEYSDADLNPAQELQIRIDGGASYALIPLNLDGFDQPVVYKVSELPCPGNWQIASFSVVNGGILSTFEFSNPGTAVFDDLLEAPVLELYPNPARERILVKSEQNAVLRLFNLRGQLVKEFWLADKSGELDLTGLPTGLYILRQGHTSKRFFKY